MKASKGTRWRFLIVEDKPDIIRQLREISPQFVKDSDVAEVDECQNFSQAIDRLNRERYDLLILDLKDNDDDGTEEKAAGLKVFEELKKSRFLPIVFYTALPEYVREYETSFVRVVEKTESVVKVRDEVKKLIEGQLPMLTRHIEEVQRSYMWDFVSTHWKEFDLSHQQGDVSYLLARRLSLSLEKEARTLAHQITGEETPPPDADHIHPMQMYIRPVIGTTRLAGDILQGSIAGETAHWMVLTPSCDLEQKKAHNVLLAKCFPLKEQDEYVAWKKEANANTTSALEKLIGDNRQKKQPERFKFLPGTYFLPDSVVDFQNVRVVPVGDLDSLTPIASLDSPFSESVLSRFSRYFGRLGTPDLDKALVIKRLSQ